MSERDAPLAVLRSARIVHPSERVEAALDRMAGQIGERLADTRPVVLAIMNGGAFTAVGLCRRFRFPYEFDYVHATRYGHAVSGAKLEWKVEPSAALSGRTVLIVDDVLDHGVTLAALQERLRDLAVGRIETAVLVRKTLADDLPRPSVDYVGLEAGDRFLFGCGMDYAGFWRGLPDIYEA